MLIEMKNSFEIKICKNVKMKQRQKMYKQIK